MVEYKVNVDNFQKAQAKSVGFSEGFQLLHNMTGMFLGFNSYIQSGKNLHEMNLYHVSGGNTVFKLLASKEFRNSSNTTPLYSEQLIIADSDLKFFLVPDIGQSRCKNQKTMVSPSFSTDKDFLLSRAKRPDIQKQNSISGSLRLEGSHNPWGIHLIAEQRVRWKMNLFGEKNSKCNYLLSGDILWLHHLQLNLSLINTLDKGGIGGFKKYNLTFQDVDKLDSNYITYGGSSQGLWIIEKKGTLRNESISALEPFYLKHVESTYYLSVRDCTVIETIKAPDESCIFYFKKLSCDSDEAIPICKGSLVKLFALSGDLQIKATEYGSTLENKGSIASRNRRLSTSVFSKSSISRRLGNYQPCISTEDLDYECFRIFDPLRISIMESFFLKNIIPKIQEYKQVLEEEIYKPIDYSKKHKAKAQFDYVLKALEEFCLNKLYFSSPENRYGEPNFYRQKYMRENYIIDFLVDILVAEIPENSVRKIFTDHTLKKVKRKVRNIMNKINVNKMKIDCIPGMIKSKKDTTPLKIEVAASILKVLSSICANNKSNQLHLYGRISEISHLGSYMIEATKCFNQILKNNQDILTELSSEIRILLIENSVDSEDFTPRGNLLIRSKTADFFNTSRLSALKGNIIFSYYKELIRKGSFNTNIFTPIMEFILEICDNDSTAASINREILYSLLIDGEKTKSDFLINLIPKDDDIVADLPEIGNVSLTTIFDEKNDEYGEMKGYISKQLELYSIFARSANYSWKLFLQIYLPSINLTRLLESRLTSPLLRGLLMQIKIHLYICTGTSRLKTIPDFLGEIGIKGEEDLISITPRKNSIKVSDAPIIKSFMSEAILYIKNIVIKGIISERQN